MMTPLYIFLHIPKTAGMSFVEILERNFRSISHWSHTKPPYLKYKEGLQCIHGHLSIAQWEALECFKDRQKIYFTFLREPWQRTISYFYFGFRGANFMEWVHNKPGDKEYNARIINSQVWMLSGDKVLNSYSVTKAFDNVKQYNINIGITEHFQESIERFQVKYPDIFKSLDWTWQNRGKHKPTYINNEYIAEASILNDLDNRLYDMLNRRWECGHSY